MVHFRPPYHPRSHSFLSLSPEVVSLLYILLTYVYVRIHMLTHPTQSTLVHTCAHICMYICTFLKFYLLCGYVQISKST